MYTVHLLQNACLAAILTSIVCGVIGSLVVVNRLVFLTGGIAHAAYGGIGLAFFLGLPVIPCTLAFSTLFSLLFALLTLQRQDTDTLIGVLWAAGMSLGILLLDFTPGYNVDLLSYLFGSILTVSPNDLWLMLCLVIIICSGTFLFFPAFLALSYDQEFARTRGVPVSFVYCLLVCMTGLTVVMVVQVVGLLLVIALMTIPPFLAKQQSTSLGGMIIRAIFWSTVFSLGGLLLAFKFDLSSGASIIALASSSFLATSAWQHIKTCCRHTNKSSTKNSPGPTS